MWRIFLVILTFSFFANSALAQKQDGSELFGNFLKGIEGLARQQKEKKRQRQFQGQQYQQISELRRTLDRCSKGSRRHCNEIIRNVSDPEVKAVAYAGRSKIEHENGRLNAAISDIDRAIGLSRDSRRRNSLRQLKRLYSQMSQRKEQAEYRGIQEKRRLADADRRQVGRENRHRVGENTTRRLSRKITIFKSNDFTDERNCKFTSLNPNIYANQFRSVGKLLHNWSGDCRSGAVEGRGRLTTFVRLKNNNSYILQEDLYDASTGIEFRRGRPVLIDRSYIPFRIRNMDFSRYRGCSRAKIHISTNRNSSSLNTDYFLAIGRSIIRESRRSCIAMQNANYRRDLEDFDRETERNARRGLRTAGSPKRSRRTRRRRLKGLAKDFRVQFFGHSDTPIVEMLFRHANSGADHLLASTLLTYNERKVRIKIRDMNIENDNILARMNRRDAEIKEKKLQDKKLARQQQEKRKNNELLRKAKRIKEKFGRKKLSPFMTLVVKAFGILEIIGLLISALYLAYKVISHRKKVTTQYG